MASQSSRLASLPVEVQQRIYRFVLCPPLGILVTTSTEAENRSFLECLIDPPPFFTVQHINPPILRVCKSINSIAWDVLYFYQDDIILHLTVDICRYFLLYVIHPDTLARIRNLSFTRAANWLVFANSSHNSIVLSQLILVPRMSNAAGGCLQNISVDIPDDVFSAIPLGLVVQEDQGYMWYLTDYLVRIFRDGYFKSLRFVHPRQYPADISPYTYHNVLFHLQPFILGIERSGILCRQAWAAMEAVVEEYYYSMEPMPPNDYILDEKYRRYVEVISNAWNNSGFSLHVEIFEDPRIHQSLTVLALTRCRRNE